tara:strand:- start:453 stop:779 length:327 start_codon:yes stop_codon:yes gene_type:complete
MSILGIVTGVLLMIFFSVLICKNRARILRRRRRSRRRAYIANIDKIRNSAYNDNRNNIQQQPNNILVEPERIYDGLPQEFRPSAPPLQTSIPILISTRKSPRKVITKS